MNDTSESKLEEVVKMIRGDLGTVVRLKIKRADDNKTIRTKLKRVKMMLVDGEWIRDEQADDPYGFAGLSKFKTMEFAPEGSFKFELEEENEFMGFSGGENHWVAEKVKGDTLLVDIEDSEEMITYRVEVEFIDDQHARISVVYDGVGEEPEVRDYRLIPSSKTPDDSEKGE
jgi:hypothetical protein